MEGVLRWERGPGLGVGGGGEGKEETEMWRIVVLCATLPVATVRCWVLQRPLIRIYLRWTAFERSWLGMPGGSNGVAVH